MGYEWIGYLLGWTVVFFLASFVLVSERLSKKVKTALIAGIVLHALGAFLRHYLLYNFYNGSGDAAVYFNTGIGYAERYANFDFNMFFDPTEWWIGQWYGGEFINWVTGWAVLLVGPTQRGVFLFFALVSFIGPVVLGFKIMRRFPQVHAQRYLFLLWCWPSLWFWPSSIGKESLVLLGICLAVAGYLGTGKRPQWLLMAAGVGLVYCIRPQVAAVVIASLALAQWLSWGGEWTPARILQGSFIAILGVALCLVSVQAVGIESYGEDGVVDYLSGKAQAGFQSGGSTVEAIGVGWTNIPVALITVFFRPFLWETHNIMALISALETVGLWGLVWYYRSDVAVALRNWRSNRLLCFAFPFIFLYAIPFGMITANLGILVRQRVFLFPFLFVLIAWGAAAQPSAQEAPPRQRTATA